ncbi:hypothetical protein [Bacillus sp. NPDC094106]|uniref:hypothetical protein n=1 Tax=Bacillus sp. NPDC094106 TaxID=3363949 RepID=UPI0038215274
MCKKQMLISPKFTREIQYCRFCNVIAELHVSMEDNDDKVSGYFCETCVEKMKEEQVLFCQFKDVVDKLRRNVMKEWIVVTNKESKNNKIIFKKIRFRKKSIYFIEMETFYTEEPEHHITHESDFVLLLDDVVYGNWFIEKEKEGEKQCVS